MTPQQLANHFDDLLLTKPCDEPLGLIGTVVKLRTNDMIDMIRSGKLVVVNRRYLESAAKLLHTIKPPDGTNETHNANPAD